MVKKIFVISMICIITCHAQAGEDIFSEKDKMCLLDLARYAITSYLIDGKLPEVDKNSLSKSLLLERACFVTLTKKGSGLRGCIGLFERDHPIYENVMDRAIAAATRDPRFLRVNHDELKDIQIEISILTVPEKLSFHSPDDLLAKLRPLVDGVILETRFGSSTYLPQVWEQLPDKKEFLSRLSSKHGAPYNFWKKDPKNIKVSTYQAIVFSEKNYGGDVDPASGCMSVIK